MFRPSTPPRDVTAAEDDLIQMSPVKAAVDNSHPSKDAPRPNAEPSKPVDPFAQILNMAKRQRPNSTAHRSFSLPKTEQRVSRVLRRSSNMTIAAENCQVLEKNEIKLRVTIAPSSVKTQNQPNRKENTLHKSNKSTAVNGMKESQCANTKRIRDMKAALDLIDLEDEEEMTTYGTPPGWTPPLTPALSLEPAQAIPHSSDIHVTPVPLTQLPATLPISHSPEIHRDDKSGTTQTKSIGENKEAERKATVEDGTKADTEEWDDGIFRTKVPLKAYSQSLRVLLPPTVQVEDESTDCKLAMLASLHANFDVETLLETLLGADGSVERAMETLNVLARFQEADKEQTAPTKKAPDEERNAEDGAQKTEDKGKEKKVAVQSPAAAKTEKGIETEKEATIEKHTPEESPFEVQNRLMRESQERARLAKQREKELEEQEEAARKERLKRKIEAIGEMPAPRYDTEVLFALRTSSVSQTRLPPKDTTGPSQEDGIVRHTVQKSNEHIISPVPLHQEQANGVSAPVNADAGDQTAPFFNGYSLGVVPTIIGDIDLGPPKDANDPAIQPKQAEETITAMKAERDSLGDELNVLRKVRDTNVSDQSLVEDLAKKDKRVQQLEVELETFDNKCKFLTDQLRKTAASRSADVKIAELQDKIRTHQSENGTLRNQLHALERRLQGEQAKQSDVAKILRGGAHLVQPAANMKLPKTIFGCIDCYVKGLQCDNSTTCWNCEAEGDACFRWQCSVFRYQGNCEAGQCELVHDVNGWLMTQQMIPEW